MRDPYKTLFQLLLPVTIGLAACGEEGAACMPVADDATECPASADVDKDDLSGSCGSTIRQITGEGELGTRFNYGYTAVDSGTTGETGQQCCYPVVESKATCVYGRPYVVDGSSRVAASGDGAAWVGDTAPALEGMHPEAREALAQAWLEAALDEHAAVAAFGKVALELMALGAPPELVSAHHRAAIEEVEHARLGFGLASAYAGQSLAPGAFPLGEMKLAATLTELAVAAAREGCLGETLTTLVVAESLAHITDPGVRAVLERILAEEQGHAALAWRTVRWALDAGADRAAVAAVFADAEAHEMALPLRIADGPHRDVLVAHGVPDSAMCARAIRRGLAEVVLPAARSLLARAA